MNIEKVSCTACGAPLSISPDIENIKCEFCGSTFQIQRNEREVSLKIAEEVSQSIQEVGTRTQTSIEEQAQQTRSELQRLQLQQELSSLQIQLSGTQSEIRELNRAKKTRKIKGQLKELQANEAQIMRNMRILRSQISRGSSSGEKISIQTTSDKDWMITLILSLILGLFGAHRFYTGHFKSGLLQLVTFGGFGIWWMIDILLIATNKFRDGAGYTLAQPNKFVGQGCAASVVIFFASALLLTGVSPDLGTYVGLGLGVVAFLYLGIWRQIRTPQ